MPDWTPAAANCPACETLRGMQDSVDLSSYDGALCGMARRKPVIDVEITEGAIRIRHAGRVLTVAASPPPPDAEDSPDFIVRLDDLEHWDAPHDETEIDVEELQLVLAAIEDECDRHGLSVEFD